MVKSDNETTPSLKGYPFEHQQESSDDSDVSKTSLSPFLSIDLSKIRKARDERRKPIVYLDLTKGPVAYHLHGSGPLVVCLHSLSTFSYIFKELMAYLAQHGYSVLTFDFYGRGRSPLTNKCCDLPFDEHFYVSQTCEVLDYLGYLDDSEPKSSFTLLGHGLGGGIAVAFASRVDLAPFVSSIVLLDPVGLPNPAPSRHMFMWGGCLASCFLECMSHQYIADSLGDDFYHNGGQEGVEYQYRKRYHSKWQRMHSLGHTQVLHGTLRDFPLGNLKHCYAEIGRLKLPCLVVWGHENTPFRNPELLSQLVPQSETFHLKNHSRVPIESFSLVVDRIRHFLCKKHDKFVPSKFGK